jgi:hypothetical protein
MKAAREGDEAGAGRTTGETETSQQALFRSERALLAKDGLPGREWYKTVCTLRGLHRL